jgi:tyrosyl-tRNA synthetase
METLAADPEEVARQLSVITKGAEEVISASELEAKIVRSLATGRPLVAKLGADPSAPDIHLGHTVVLTKLKQIQDLGHQVVFLIGDFTGRIGDPTGRSETRKALTGEEVEANARTYREQIFKILDPERTRVAFNSEWLAGMDFAGVLALSARYTVARLLERDDFARRFSGRMPIGVHELMYPLMQGYDSVALAADIELGGTDQKFNLLVGRDLQRSYGQPAQVAITMPILEGTDGKQKMSKSLGNYVGIHEPAESIFGKVMSISDDQMFRWLLLLTDRPEAEVERLRGAVAAGREHPMELKLALARDLAARYTSAPDAARAEQEFGRVVRNKELPGEMPTFALAGLADEEVFIVHLFQRAFGGESSVSHLKRLLSAGALRMDGARVTDEHLKFRPRDIRPGTVLQMGKRGFVRLV